MSKADPHTFNDLPHDTIHAIFAELTPDERVPVRLVCSSWRALVDERFPGDRTVWKLRVAWSLFQKHSEHLVTGVLPQACDDPWQLYGAQVVFDANLELLEAWRGERSECKLTLIEVPSSLRHVGRTWGVALFAAAAAWCIDGTSVCVVTPAGWGNHAAHTISSEVLKALRILAKHNAPSGKDIIGIRGALNNFCCCTSKESCKYEYNMLILYNYDCIPPAECLRLTQPLLGTTASMVGITI